jgi:hypothetical protein
MDSVEIESRMRELIKPIDEAIMYCDTREEILMLASVMLTRLRIIYDNEIGEVGRKEMFRGMTE